MVVFLVSSNTNIVNNVKGLNSVTFHENEGTSIILGYNL